MIRKRGGGSAVILGAMIGFLASCAGERMNEVTVVGTDYAFQAPATLRPGRTLFVFENRGRVDHEMILARLKPGVTLQQALEMQRSGGDPKEVMDAGAGVLFADPGEISPGTLLVDLAPGRTYALLCFFRDAEQAPPHAAMGMVASFQVE
jgi:uncharacterized cupredoxin-like copper-binding protein